MRLAGKNVVVAGLAASGLAVAEFLSARGARVLAVDLKPLAELTGVADTLERLGVPFALQSEEAFAGADAIVISPGVPADIDELQQARRRGIPVLGEVELAGWFLQGNTIGITGANGKTTTTALAGHILKEAGVPVQVGGNIGTPVTAMIATSRPGQWNVLELSSFQLETIDRFRAHIGVCVNVTPDHLDRHHTFENYARAKGRLFETQQPGDFAVLNADDPTCAAYAARTRATPVWFSFTPRGAGASACLPERAERSAPRAGQPGMYADSSQVFYDGQPFLAVARIPLRGRHNVENAMAAAAAAHLAGVPLEAIAAAVESFPGVEHRIEFVRKLDGVDFYNDSKATNVDATQKAIDAFPGGLWIILGGKDKGSDYTVLREPLRQKAKAALLVGAAASKIEAHLGDAVRLIDAGTIAEAVRAAWREAAPGDTILLAPACASFDQFTGYEHRGKVFKDLVRALESRG